MKALVKRYLLPALLKLNTEQLYHTVAKGNILNIFYHGVVETDSTKFFPRHIGKNQFEQHIKYLNSKFNIISIEEAFNLYQQNIKPDRSTITISFDDGYFNNVLNALPILEKYNVKATFFISGICLEDESYIMWSDIIAFARYFSNDNYVMINNLKFNKIGKYDLINNENNQSAYVYIKNLPYTERDLVLKDIKDQYRLNDKINDLPQEIWKLMNRTQIKHLADSELVSIGSHGHLHYNLANISYEEARNEMQKSRKLLSELTGQKITLISFPDGSYNENIKELAYSLGYTQLLAVDYRCPSDVQDKRILNRWGISATTSFETVAFTLNKAFIKHAF